MSPKINTYRLDLATIEEIRSEMYAGIHTVAVPECPVYNGFSMGVKGQSKSYLNLNKYARQREMGTYYIPTFSAYQEWFRKMEDEFYGGRCLEIHRADVMADTKLIPWMKRRKYDIALMYAMYAAQNGNPTDKCLMYRYNNREPSLKVSIDESADIASYDRTKNEDDTSGVQDRLEFRLLKIRTKDEDGGRHIVSDVSQLREVLEALCGNLKGLSLRDAEEQSTADIITEMQREEYDGGRVVADRSLPEIIGEFEYRIFSTRQVEEIGKILGINESYARRMAAQHLGKAKINLGDFNDYVETVRSSISRFVEG